MKVVLLNGERINYDRKIDYKIIDKDIVVYDNTTIDEVLERVEGFDVVITKEIELSYDLIKEFPASVKMICEAGTGYNNINLKACKEKNIIVTNVPSYSTNRVAHTTMMFILNLSASMHQQELMIAYRNFSNFTNNFRGDYTEIYGKTLGVIGTGKIGSEVIKLANAFGMNVIAYSHKSKKDTKHVKYVPLEELVMKSDYITLHSALTEDNYHMLDQRMFNKMKKGVFIINTSRGALIDEEALISSLKNGIVKGAALDVFEHEPLDENSEFFDLNNVILTPHFSWQALECRERLVSIVADNVKALNDGKPINVVS